VFLYRSVAKLSERAGVLGEDAAKWEQWSERESFDNMAVTDLNHMYIKTPDLNHLCRKTP
jgi:hypothetical protein